MEIASTRKKFAAIDILKNYNGNNSYILLLKHHVVVLGDSSCLNEFSTEYILRNHETEPKTINKVTRISDWYGEAIQKKYSLDFTPKK